MKTSLFKIPICVLLFLAFNTVLAKDKNFKLQSPDGTIVVEVKVDQAITYSIFVDQEQVIDAATLALTVNENNVLGAHPKLIKRQSRSVDKMLYPELKVKSAEIRDRFNEITLTFKGNYKVVFRAFNNGVAYRFETQFDKDLIVTSETAKFNFTNNNLVYFPREDEFQSHNERLYERLTLDSLSNEDLCSLPALIATQGKTKLLITETGLLDYPGMWLTGTEDNSLQAVFPPVALEEKVDNTRWTDDRTIRVSKKANYIAKTKGARAFPWRIIAVSKTDADLITNQLTYQLAEPSRIADCSWIQPGKVAWDWWNYNNIYGVDFKAGVNTDTYKYYIDFASKYGLEYIILDEGWYKLGDVLDVVPEVDVEALIRYGKEKNVGLILWVTWSSLDQKLEAALDAFQSWGAKGLKIDFMQRDDQWMVKYYERIAKACADHKLLVDFHGSYKPSGLRRTYPNVLTREGVKGNENNKWADYITPEHNVTLPFIRMVAGPMDYTPGAMINTQQENFGVAWNKPMSLGTRCHQLAMYVCFESPSQMLCDSPSNYYKEPECMEFLSAVPAVWDETIVLDAKVSDYLMLARKHGDNWYVGAMTDWSSRDLTLNLSFLPKDKKYEMTLYQDGINADRIAIDFKQSRMVVDSAYSSKIHLSKGGGLAVILTPVQ
ncbi:glycoside hydrolase family 97 protein [Snuella sedimenti]|uniref:Glycoside hydrolase family 97 protein n=1 Tax=Snuella sedimenti TaxID=2798802 RepID=A0A8J7LRY3_9FLAO|nr:glycoside hydrolase family 97 protein [Snuella sedimenti]MBJ6367785.1 glycoside hydrolase family 97 protein [Snuella sedimenti]